MENMDIHSYKLCLLLFLLALPSSYATSDDRAEGLQSYIVHVDPSPDSNSILTSNEQRESWYKSFLPVESRLIYSYHNAMSGFAATLTKQELAELEKKPGFLHAYPDGIVPLLTTHSHQFLGLHRYLPGLWNSSNLGQGVIIGVLDYGISPEHPSFSDNGAIPPPPNGWGGVCEFGPSVCNNKLIGARSFLQGLRAMQHNSTASTKSLRLSPPFDTTGHGTHCAGIAAGMFVDNANIEGQANSTAAGMAPHAHLAIYKVCDDRGCAYTDILAGFDAAISDGVDVLSISLGGGSRPYYNDGIAIGAFAAAARGIFVSCGAGNSGPSYFSTSNEAPWMLTVGASTMDRRITAVVTLGNGKELNGEASHQPEDYTSPSLPLVYPGTACTPGSLSNVDVVGMIVVCDGGVITGRSKGEVVKLAGGAGMIIANTATEGYSIADLSIGALPQSQVTYADGAEIKTYIDSAGSTPTASITFKGTEIGPRLVAPAVAYFSSRGPSRADRNILKPDIIGPGVNVIAAWPFEIGTPGTNYNFASGTSMATPHLSGIAALLKSMHPDWSPAAIKSAIMTTASNTANDGRPIVNHNRNPADFFVVGAGHVDPLAANNPGLVYDIDTRDYTGYLCGLGYSDTQVSSVVRTWTRCSDFRPITGSDLNYPSIIVSAQPGDSVTVTRTVTNVGAAVSTYAVNVVQPAIATVTVEPNRLSFSSVGEKQPFTVRFAIRGGGAGYSFGYLTWVSSDGNKVRSPITVALGTSENRQSM